jgi:hypothetical protein
VEAEGPEGDEREGVDNMHPVKIAAIIVKPARSAALIAAPTVD